MSAAQHVYMQTYPQHHSLLLSHGPGVLHKLQHLLHIRLPVAGGGEVSGLLLSDGPGLMVGPNYTHRLWSFSGTDTMAPTVARGPKVAMSHGALSHFSIFWPTGRERPFQFGWSTPPPIAVLEHLPDSESKASATTVLLGRERRARCAPWSPARRYPL